MMWNVRRLWIQWRGNVLHLELIWGTPIYFAFLKWHQSSSLVVTEFLGILFSSNREIEVPYVFDWEHGTPHREMHGNRASSCGEEEVWWVFSSCGRHLVYILELQQGWPFETRVCSAKSGLQSSYERHLGKLNYAWQENTDASGCELGGQASLIRWHSYIGIPINFHEESVIVTFWSNELSAPLDVSKGCEALCPEEFENYGFSWVSTGFSDIPSTCEMKDDPAFKALQGKLAVFESGHLGVHFTWGRKHRLALTYLFLREGSSWGDCGKLAYLFIRRQGIILIRRRYGVHGTFLKLL